MKSLQTTDNKQRSTTFYLPQTTLSDSWLQAQTIDTILVNPELRSIRSLTHNNVSEADKKTFEEYRMLMVGTFAKTINYIKTGITFEKDMVIEFVDVICREFPNWKPEDFMLFCRMMREGTFANKYEQSADFPMLVSWAHRYDEMKLRAIESERVTYKQEDQKPLPKVSPEEVEQVLKDFYSNAKRPKPESELSKRAEQPERWAHIKQAQLEYRQAMKQYAFDVEGAAAHPYRILAAEDEFRKANDEKEWIAKRIFDVHGYRVEIG